MNCPQCGKPMQSGYLSAGGYRVIWTTKERKLTNLLGDNDVTLTRMSLTGKSTPADHCPGCQLVIVKYE